MPNTLLKNRYLMGSLIGSGGMANVYKGHDIRSGHTVAIKILKHEFNENQEFIRRFEREAELAAAVSHDNIVKLLDVGYEDNQHFLILEYIDGYTLKEYIRQHGALPYHLWLKIAREMASALASAHQANIIHRDIKSQNILLTRRDLTAKITDFGIAREVYTSTITASDSGILGSVHYFSPEHARGDVVDAQSDIYSFGVVLYEMATGHVPFDGETPVSIALKHLQDTPEDPDKVNPQVTADMKRIIMRCLEKDRKLRYVNTRQLCYDLDLLPAEPIYEEKVVEEAETEDTPVVETKTSERKRKKRKTRDRVWAAMAILLSVLAVGGIFIFVMELTGHPIISQFLQRDTSARRVPSVGGMTEESGIALLERSGFTVHVSREMKDNVAVGIIYDQTPPSGEAAPNGEVTIYVSNGSTQSVMPDLKSKDENSAISAVEALGLRIGDIFRMESSYPRGQVFAQDPEPGTSMQNGDLVTLYISAPPVVKSVPNVLGMDLEGAEEVLKQEGFQLGNVHYEPVTGTAPGMIFKQSPEASTDSVESATVDIWIAAAAEFIYKCETVIPLDIEQDDTVITIILEDGDTRSTVYRDRHSKGPVEIELRLESLTRGDKELIVYQNGKQIKRIIVTFLYGAGE